MALAEQYCIHYVIVISLCYENVIHISLTRAWKWMCYNKGQIGSRDTDKDIQCGWMSLSSPWTPASVHLASTYFSACHFAMTPPGHGISYHDLCHTRGDVLHQDRTLCGQSEAVGVELGVPLDLDVEAERVVPLIWVTGLCCFPICYPVSAEE